MKKITAVLFAVVFAALPGAAFAGGYYDYSNGYTPVFGVNYAYGVGGQNPYVGNCNYQDNCGYSSNAYPTYHLYWCNGVQQYWPCQYEQQQPQYYYPQQYTYGNNYYYPQTQYSYSSQYTYSNYNYNTNYMPMQYGYSW